MLCRNPLFSAPIKNPRCRLSCNQPALSVQGYDPGPVPTCSTNCQKYGARLTGKQGCTRYQPVQYFSVMAHVRNYKMVFVKPHHQHMQTASLSECDSRHRIQLISHPFEVCWNESTYLDETKDLNNLSRWNRSLPTGAGSSANRYRSPLPSLHFGARDRFVFWKN